MDSGVLVADISATTTDESSTTTNVSSLRLADHVYDVVKKAVFSETERITVDMILSAVDVIEQMATLTTKQKREIAVYVVMRLVSEIPDSQEDKETIRRIALAFSAPGRLDRCFTCLGRWCSK